MTKNNAPPGMIGTMRVSEGILEQFSKEHDLLKAVEESGKQASQVPAKEGAPDSSNTGIATEIISLRRTSQQLQVDSLALDSRIERLRRWALVNTCLIAATAVLLGLLWVRSSWSMAASTSAHPELAVAPTQGRATAAGVASGQGGDAPATSPAKSNGAVEPVPVLAPEGDTPKGPDKQELRRELLSSYKEGAWQRVVESGKALELQEGMDAETGFLLADALRRNGDVDGALARMEELLKEYPTGNYSDDAAYWAAEIHLKKGDLAVARDYYKRVIDTKNSNYLNSAKRQYRKLQGAGRSAKVPE